jgi:4-diphosphocytidyl-2-C-methyl-D-erythritol kinase
MIVFPHCKINLGLSIITKRADGYHELDTVFYPVALNDILEIISQNDTSSDIQFTSSGLAIPGDHTNNLCVKAYQLLKKDFPALPAIKMHLHKNIPMGAGLGGGSSDGTAVLKLLNQQFNLGLNKNQLVDYASKLGSDCAFFVHDNACHAKGRGEILQPINCDLSNFKIVLIHPDIHISTAWAFSQLNPQNKQKSIAEIVSGPIENWRTELINDFEAPIIKAYPMIGDIKQMLYQHGAVYASMTGSGSSIFGLFSTEQIQSKKMFDTQFRVDII